MSVKAQRQGWARLLAAVADGVVAAAVHDVHRAITNNAFRWVGPVGRPVQQVHDAVVDRVYGAVRAGLVGMGELGAATVRADPGATCSPAALKARAVAAGVVGADVLAAAPELDVEVTLRADGEEVVIDPTALRAAYPDAGEQLVVFVHGLVDTEAVWGVSSGRLDSAVLPDRVRAAGSSPLLIRYGTGRSIGRNGADLSEVLEGIVAAWPGAVVDLVLVAHSMGGLVVRAACEAALEREHTWTKRLSNVVYLGTPHLGAWLEKVANVTSWTLRVASPHSAPIGSLLDMRSRGIKDLRFGTLGEHAWTVAGVDDLLSGRAADTPWLDDVNHHQVVGRLHPRRRHPLNTVFGDTMVRQPSAAGQGRWRRITGAQHVQVHPVPAPHGRLMTHPDAAALLEDVLEPEP